MQATSGIRAAVENYMREMGVQAKYADQMFSIPKDRVRWINKKDFEVDYTGFIPDLKDWVDARCDKRTDIEKATWEILQNKMKHWQPMTAAEKSVVEMLRKKNRERSNCEANIHRDLWRKAQADVEKSQNPF
jgi:hypothetical protein